MTTTEEFTLETAMQRALQLALNPQGNLEGDVHQIARALIQVAIDTLEYWERIVPGVDSRAMRDEIVRLRSGERLLIKAINHEQRH